MTHILIYQNDRWVQYTATAGQTIFAYDFPIFDSAHLVVLKTSGGDTTLLTITTDYTVSGVGVEGGGNVTLTAGATAGDVYTIYGDTPKQRITDYPTKGDFLANTVNDELDLMTMMIQEMRRAQNRAPSVALHIPEGDIELGDDAGYVYWDGTDLSVTTAPGSVATGAWVLLLDEVSLVSSPAAQTYESPALSQDYNELRIFAEDVEFDGALNNAVIRLQWHQTGGSWLESGQYAGLTTIENPTHLVMDWTHTGATNKDGMACTSWSVDFGDKVDFWAHVFNYSAAGPTIGNTYYPAAARTEGDGVISAASLDQFRLFGIEQNTPFTQTNIVGGKIWVWGRK